MSQGNRVWHQFRGFIRGVAEHHSLISCADCLDLLFRHFIVLCFQRPVNAHGNIRGLLVDCRDHAAGICVKSKLPSCVANLPYRIPDDLLDIYVSVGGNLSHNKYKARGGACLACHAAHGILLHKRIQDRIGYLVAHLVRVAFCY